MMATVVRIRCLICGDTTINMDDLRLIVEGSGVDCAFVHCDTETRRRLDPIEVSVLVAYGIEPRHPYAPAHCRCGLAFFPLDGGVVACRNCDTPTPGLPPADRSYRQ